MKTRTCPNCCYRYKLIDFGFKPFLLPEWNCKNCGVKLKNSHKRKYILALIGCAPAAAYPYLARYLSEFFPVMVSFVLAIVFLLVWAILIFSLNNFSQVDSAKARFPENS